MKDIHSIGQAFKIVSEKGTAKRKTSKLITDGDSTIRGSITSQEFPSQKFLYFERCQDGYIEYNIPTNTKIRMVLDKIEFEIEQARAEIIKEVIRFIGREFNVLISGKKLTQSETIELLNMEIKNHFEQLEKEGKK